MANFIGFLYIIIFNAIFSSLIYASDDKVDLHDFIDRKINVHFLDPMHLTLEDCQDIHDNLGFYHLYGYESNDKLKKDQYSGFKSQNPMEYLDSKDVINNKEKLEQLKKTRANTLHKSLIKGKSNKLSEDLDFVPLHFEAIISNK